MLALIRDCLMEAIRGLDPREIGVLHAGMDRVAKGASYAKSAIDIACHDIAGKALGVPVSTLLGGRRREGVRVTHSLGLMPIEDALTEAENAVSEGITVFKLKTGIDGDRDVELMRRMRQVVGPGIELRVDANEGYATVGEAVRITLRQQEFDLYLCEQPVAGAHGLAQVAQRIGVPVMADESAWTTHDILELHQYSAAECFSCYVTKPGGLWRARQQADIAAALGMYHDIGGSIEFGIGTAANLHLGVALERAILPSVCPVTTLAGAGGPQVAGVYYLDDITTEAFEFRDGVLICPDGPGLGIEVDEAKLVKYCDETIVV